MYNTLLDNALDFYNREQEKRGYRVYRGDTVIVAKHENGNIIGCVSTEIHAEKILIKELQNRNINCTEITDIMLLDANSKRAIIPCNECIEYFMATGFSKTRVWMGIETCFIMLNVRHVIAQGKESKAIIKDAIIFPEEYKTNKDESPQVIKNFQILKRLIDVQNIDSAEEHKKEKMLKKKSLKSKMKSLRGWFL